MILLLAGARTRSSNPISRRSPLTLRAYWVTPATSGFAVTPARCTRPVLSSMEEQHVVRLQQERLDSEEVAAQNALRLGSEKSGSTSALFDVWGWSPARRRGD